MNKRTRIALFVLGAIVVALLAYGFWPSSVLVDIQAAVREPLEVSLEEEARTRVIDRYVVSAPVAGYAPRLALEVGDSVAQGQTLIDLESMPSAALDPRSLAEARARVSAARASLNAAHEAAEATRAEAELATADLDRMQALFDGGSATRQRLDQARTTARSAEAQRASAEFRVEIAQHDLEAARTALQYAGSANRSGSPISITAPVSGNVLAILQESEGIVQQGQPLLEIGDPAALEIVSDVLSSDAVRISPGTQVSLERWGGEMPLRAVVRTVQPVGFTKISALGVEEQRVLVVCDITSPRSDWIRLGDGYRVVAHFLLWQGDEVLQIPTNALFRNDGGWAAFVVDEGTARLRSVEVGQRNGMQAEILSGLEEGTEVIIHPDDAIQDGTPIERTPS